MINIYTLSNLLLHFEMHFSYFGEVKSKAQANERKISLAGSCENSIKNNTIIKK